MIKVISQNDQDDFENKVNKLIKDGYKIIASSCGFVNSENYDFADWYQAILEKNEV